MYESIPDLTTLRQGDVVGPLPLPRFSLAQSMGLQTLSPGPAPGNLGGMLLVPGDSSFGVVVSQCCEFNPQKRQTFSMARLLSGTQHRARRDSDLIAPSSFSLARLMLVAKSYFRKSSTFDAATIEELRLANDVTTAREGAVSYLNAYLYEPDGDHLKEAYVADFSDLVSLRIKEVPAVLQVKRLQLSDASRRSFQLKLGLYFSRAAT